MENSAVVFDLWNIYVHAHAHTGIYTSQMQWEMGTVSGPNLIDQKIIMQALNQSLQHIQYQGSE